MRPAFLLVLLLLAASVGGCTEVVRQYRADNTGTLQHTRTFVPEWGSIGKRVSYTLNGTTFSFDLSAIGGDARGHRRPPKELRAGSDFTAFVAGNDASLLEGAFGTPGVTWYGGNIHALSSPSSPTSDLYREANARGISKRYFAKSPTREYRSVNGRRWMITTTFENRDRSLVEGRVFWTIGYGFLVTFNVNFTSAPTDPTWRQKRLARLEKLISDFRMYRTSNEAMQRTASRAAFELTMTSTFNPQPSPPSPALADLGSR
jgi:hypothetical protein